MTEYEEDLMKE